MPIKTPIQKTCCILTLPVKGGTEHYTHAVHIDIYRVHI